MRSRSTARRPTLAFDARSSRNRATPSTSRLSPTGHRRGLAHRARQRTAAYVSPRALDFDGWPQRQERRGDPRRMADGGRPPGTRRWMSTRTSRPRNQGAPGKNRTCDLRFRKSVGYRSRTRGCPRSWCVRGDSRRAGSRGARRARIGEPIGRAAAHRGRGDVRATTRRGRQAGRGCACAPATRQPLLKIRPHICADSGCLLALVGGSWVSDLLRARLAYTSVLIPSCLSPRPGP